MSGTGVSPPPPGVTLFCLSLFMQSMRAGYPPEKRHRCTEKRGSGWGRGAAPQNPPEMAAGGAARPHLPGPARRTRCSSCPPGHRGSRGPSGAWAAPPPCGGTEGAVGRGGSAPKPSPCPSLPCQGLPEQDRAQPGGRTRSTGRETEAQNGDSSTQELRELHTSPPHPSDTAAAPQHPAGGLGKAPSVCSRQLVVGLQAFRLHIVNCRDRREGLEGGKEGEGAGNGGPGGCPPSVPAGSPAAALTLDLVEVAGLLLGEQVGMCVLAWIHLVHEERAEPAALGIPGVPPVGQRGRETPGVTGNDREPPGMTAKRDPEASLPLLPAAASIVRLPGSPRTPLAPSQFALGAPSQFGAGSVPSSSLSP